MADWNINSGNPTSTVSGPTSTPQGSHLASTVLGPKNDPNYAPWVEASKNSNGAIFFADGRWQQRWADGRVNDMLNPGEISAVADVVDGRKDIQGNSLIKPPTPYDGTQDGISARMQAFIREMLGDFDTNDPVYRGLIQAGTDAAQQSAGRAGLAGRSTLAGTQAASVAQQNVQPWMAARKAAGAQMLTQLSNRDISLGNLAQGQQQIDAGLAASKNAAEKNFWGTLGAVGGGVLGAYVGGPGGAQAGAQIGSGAMSGLAGGSSGPAQPAQTWKPGGGYKPPSGSGY
ncbi:MAG: hypothetical protein ACYCZR_03430 [Burkholderiales bacterium]